MKNEMKRTPKAAIRKAGAITLMTATAALSMMNPAFADTACGGQSAEQSVKKAAVQQSSRSSADTAKKEVKKAERAKAESRSRLEQAKADLADAQEAESRAEEKMKKTEKASSDAEDKMNEAFNGLKEKCEKELEKKKDAESEAKDRYEAAADEEDAEETDEEYSGDEEDEYSEDEGDEEEFADDEEEYDDEDESTDDEEEYDDEDESSDDEESGDDEVDEDGHSEEYYEAEEALNDAIDRRNSLEEQARQCYKESVNAGVDFIDSRTSEGCSIEDWRETLENSSLSEYATDEVFDRVRDSFSISSLRKSVKLMKECNELRAKEDNWKGAAGKLSVNYDLMVFSAVSCAVSAEKKDNGGGLDHVLFNSSIKASGFDYGGRAENLAWGYSDPFRGWYDKEKSRYYQLRDSGVENPNSSNYKEVGHFTNMTDPHWNIMGLTAGNVSELALANGSSSHATVSISDFEDELDECADQIEEKTDRINREYQEACSDIEENRQKLMSIAAEEENDADEEYSDDEDEYDESYDEDADDTEDYDEDTYDDSDEYDEDTEETDEDTEDLDQLRQEYEDAVKAREEAEKRLEAAGSVDRDDPDTYSSSFPELAKLVKDTDAKKKAAKKAAEAYDKARADVSDAEDALATAKQEYRQACDDLKIAKDNYERALKREKVGKPKITVKAGRRLIKVKIKKVKRAKKYQIKVKKQHGSWKTYTVRGTKKTIRRLSKGRKYYVKARTIGKNGTKSAYSRTKTVRVK